MTTTKVKCSSFVLIIFFGSLIDIAFAQNDSDSQSNFIKTIGDLDELLSTHVTATLTGLSLAGATFLVRAFKDDEEDLKRLTGKAQTDFIKSFIMFLICTIAIFIFDFLEILLENPSLFGLVLDLVITYGFFGIGIVYLIKSASDIRKMYRK